MVKIEKRLKIIKKINEAVGNGIMGRRELAKTGKVSINTLCLYEKKGYITLPKVKRGRPKGQFKGGKIAENRNELDRLLFDEGETLEDVGEKIGVRRQYIGQYIKDSERYKKWKEAKERKKTVIPNLVDVLIKVAIKKGYENGIGEALKYHFKKWKHKKIHGEGNSLDNLIKLIEIYKQAEKIGEKLSYKELAYLSGIKYPTQVGKILDEGNLKSFYGNINIKRTSKDKKEAIKRAVDLDYLSYVDLGYFIGVNVHVIKNNLRGKRGSVKYSIKKFGKIKSEIEFLMYKDASQIYFFKDEFNSSNEELTEAIGKSKKLVEYALENRDEIEAKLVHALEVLYPNEKISKGYR